jgi:peptidoglycan hydrolase-like protein with peptidoglycan-binding domain
LLGFACGNEDGVFGRNTKAAVMEYQRSKGLVADGIIGAKTWESLGI